MRGQALVEFALILPIFLLLVLGSIQVHSALWQRDELSHAVREGAIAGASSNGDRCGAALAALAKVYSGRIEDVACRSNEVLELEAAIDLELIVPGWEAWRISASERAIIR